MRLKKLTIQAFGPFKDKISIDFTKEKIDSGLLLISGDTGSGKTTIFDAICFALYGESSSTSRETNSLRSDWASSNEETYVDLEFYYKNKLYEVKRSPEYTRKKKSGTGETKQPPTASFTINNRIITKVTEVTKEIENLIGLNYKQFRQVAMLSQGEFTKFLLASSEEKTNIFRKIFQTDLYDNLQNKLKSNKITKESELKRIIDKIDTEKNNIIDTIDTYSLSDEETIKVLDNKIKDDKTNSLNIKEKRDKKNEEKIKITTELDNLTNINNKIKEYNKSITDLNTLLKDNSNIKEEKKQYDYNINIASSITNILDLITKDKKLLKSKEDKLTKSKEELLNKQKLYKEKEEVFNKLNDYSKNVSSITDEITSLSLLRDKYDTYLNKVNELTKTKELYKELVTKYETENNTYENMRKEYYLNISVEIADSLVENEPCPVCGSLNHPNKATPIECNFTKDDLLKKEKELSKIDNDRKTKEAILDQLHNIINELSIPKDLDVLTEKNNLNNQIKEKNESKDKLNNEFTRISKEKEKLISTIKSLEDNIKIFSEDIIELKTSISNNENILTSIYNDNNTSYEEYLKYKLEKYDLLKLKDKINKYQENKQILETKIKTLEIEVKDKEIVDLTEKEKERTNIEEEYKLLDKEYLSLNSSLEKLKASTNNIKKYIKEKKSTQSEYDIIKVLNDTANGNLTGKQRITFENYVQSYFMQSVLIEANKRLIKMTDARYELKKKEIEIKKNMKTGLDFSIFDSYTGKERDVSSLSGGEKFKASLALALGLSDTISNNQGGIKIDSLFIDEGFGSLDSESLNQALNILLDLTSNDKLVGVISHVSELLSRIDNKILVNKTNTGSVISLETSI